LISLPLSPNSTNQQAHHVNSLKAAIPIADTMKHAPIIVEQKEQQMITCGNVLNRNKRGLDITID
jgi:hypothetical protein